MMIEVEMVGTDKVRSKLEYKATFSALQFNKWWFAEMDVHGYSSHLGCVEDEFRPFLSPYDTLSVDARDLSFGDKGVDDVS
ncbi:hypothetical protein OIU84_006994 [Salix udensis]|uniref:Uncharacterized protein n=1 Tax=Salix udensis TaxID=889485 RepID=A0AAD6JZP4_9ROSI|nr:hypothetical protein OIU84_006994 [Salix udensis]